MTECFSLKAPDLFWVCFHYIVESLQYVKTCYEYNNGTILSEEDTNLASLVSCPLRQSPKQQLMLLQ